MTRGARAALAVLAAFALAALLAPLLAPFSPTHQIDIIALQNRPPSAAHWLGTDAYGRDVLSRLLHGARVSLGVGALGALVAVAAGTLVGAVAGFFRGGVDATLMRIVDVGLSIPRIFLVLVAIAIGQRLDTIPLAILLGLTGWFATSRLVRAEVLAMHGTSWMEAARGLGSRPWRIILRHVVPNAATTIAVSATLAVANLMLLEAGLSFIGVGVQPPTPSWGNMIAEGRDQILSAPWISVFPGIAITLVVMALHAVADTAESPRGAGS